MWLVAKLWNLFGAVMTLHHQNMQRMSLVYSLMLTFHHHHFFIPGYTRFVGPQKKNDTIDYIFKFQCCPVTPIISHFLLKFHD